ncbi:hypothetical protein M0812_26794 [Anaeramoeba flamelloides]|uniref:THH1/TOM1/TOM3 domain-containing protein n=1 Tax=Anaeramoeba flamelloides TaxID=1746091 RepID=A0AAV7YCJ8_9EUKA|nr:hypothetical protein M0812_26794 [Anaeramoeba flamelloides]
MHLDLSKPINLSLFILSFFYLIVGIISLINLIISCVRSDKVGYKTAFFITSMVFCFGRIVTFAFTLYDNSIKKRLDYKLFSSLLTVLFLLSFMLLTFSLAKTFYFAKHLTKYDSSRITKRIILIFALFLLVLIIISILFNLFQFWKYNIIVFEVASFFTLAIILLIYCYKLLKTLPENQDNFFYKSLKRVYFVIIICTIIQVARIPVVVYLFFVESEGHVSDNFRAIFNFLYLFLSEIVTTTLILLLIIKVPIKKNQLKILDQPSENSYMTTDGSETEEDYMTYM